MRLAARLRPDPLGEVQRPPPRRLAAIGGAYTVFQKKNIHSFIDYKLRNSGLILIIFDIKIPHII